MTHPLAGCRAKLDRAEEIFISLQKEIEAFVNSDSPPYTLEKRHQKEGLEYALIAAGEPRPPLRFAVLSGEIVHHLRSSLDHLISALVTHNGHAPSRQHQFPICKAKKHYKESCYKGYIKGVGQRAKGLIEKVQPYTADQPENTVLSVVAELNNTDKHRLLVVVNSLVRIGNEIIIGTDGDIAVPEGRKNPSPTIVGMGDPAHRKLSKEGVEVFTIQLEEPAPEFTAEAKLEFNMAFEKVGSVELAPLVSTLKTLILGTRNTIEEFSGEFT